MSRADEDYLESLADVEAKLAAVELKLAAFHGLQGDVRAEIVRLVHADELVEDEQLSEWHSLYCAWLDWHGLLRNRWKVELIDAQGASISCTGQTPAIALASAERIDMWFRSAHCSAPYQRHPSTRFPGVADGSLPLSERASVPSHILAKYEGEGIR